MNAIDERASVRQYTDEPVTDEEVRAILRAAMAAPSAGNQQPWEFYVVRDAQKREALAACSPYAKPCGRAPLVLAFCQRGDDKLRWPFMAVQDMSACVENALIEIADLGLGAVWMGIAPLEDRMQATREVLGVPEGLETFALVAVGHPAEPVEAKGPGRYEEVRIHWE